MNHRTLERKPAPFPPQSGDNSEAAGAEAALLQSRDLRGRERREARQLMDQDELPPETGGAAEEISCERT